jgi:hypothetical protein
MADVTPITATDIRFSSAMAPQAARGLDALLDDICLYIRRYVVVTDHQATAVALWTSHTHAIQAADCTPYLQITSATKRAGKTRLLEVLEPLVARPWFTGRTSAAALVRKVDAECPTLLLDESDAAFAGEKEYAEALRGILNSGYRRSGKATVCIGQSANIQARDFSTFGAKAIAGIKGNLPGTVADRSIAIQLRRRTSDEPCERWRERDGHAAAAPLRERLTTWAATAVEILRDARPALPPSLGDRQADVWEPLIAIADLAGGNWSHRARSAAIALAGSVEDQDISIELLHDIYTVFEAGPLNFITSKQLVEKLLEMDDRPWAEWRHGKPITPRAIADRLKTFGIVPIPNTARTARGYARDRFEDAWTRYPAIKPSNLPAANENRPESHISKCMDVPTSDASQTAKDPINTGASDAWTLRSRETGTGADDGAF